MKINIINIILIALSVVLFWLWMSKPQTIITKDTSKQDSLTSVIKTQESVIIKRDSVIDSLETVIVEENLLRESAELALKNLSKQYDAQVENINNQSVADDIDLFRANFLSSTKSN